MFQIYSQIEEVQELNWRKFSFVRNIFVKISGRFCPHDHPQKNWNAIFVEFSTDEEIYVVSCLSTNQYQQKVYLWFRIDYHSKVLFVNRVGSLVS